MTSDVNKWREVYVNPMFYMFVCQMLLNSELQEVINRLSHWVSVIAPNINLKELIMGSPVDTEGDNQNTFEITSIYNVN